MSHIFVSTSRFAAAFSIILEPFFAGSSAAHFSLGEISAVPLFPFVLVDFRKRLRPPPSFSNAATRAARFQRSKSQTGFPSSATSSPSPPSEKRTIGSIPSSADVTTKPLSGTRTTCIFTPVSGSSNVLPETMPPPASRPNPPPLAIQFPTAASACSSVISSAFKVAVPARARTTSSRFLMPLRISLPHIGIKDADSTLLNRKR